MAIVAALAASSVALVAGFIRACFLTQLGLTKEQSTYQTPAGVEFFNALVAKLKAFGPPKMGLNVLMGKTTKPKLMNVLTHLKTGELELKNGVYKK
jgi:hypothetical protein